MDCKENEQNENDEIVLIDYYDRIHKCMIHNLPVKKEVARMLKADDQKTRRKQNQYNYYNKPIDKVFSEEHPENEKFLVDDNSSILTILDKEERDRLEAAELEHQKTLIENSLCCLTPEQHEVVVMAYYQNMSYSQIAEALGITKPAVAQRMRNAEKNIRNFIKNTQN